jgi:hypothetical protein
MHTVGKRASRKLGFVQIACFVALLLTFSNAAGAAGGKGGKVHSRDTSAPTVVISSPQAGATLSGQIGLAGTASDNVQVAKVEISVDGGAYQGAQGTTSWTYQLDTSALAGGSHTITARATDSSGNQSSTAVSVTVSSDLAPPDTTPPSVAISAPTPDSTVLGSLTITGTASDNAQVVKVEVSLDGGPYHAAQGTESWTYALDTTALANGLHSLTAHATDSSGGTAMSAESVTVQNPSSLPAGVSEQMVTPEGARIQIYLGVSGWTAQQIHDLLKPNAYQLGLIGPHLTIKVQTTYNTFTTTSAGTSRGVYTSFNATMYLNASSNSLLLTRPDATIAHEYGAVWSMYHLYLTQQGSWTPWLQARGLLGDPRVDSSDVWSKGEMIADDYRMLFGTQSAQNEMDYVNPDVPDPRTVAGLKDFFVNVWGA